KKHILALAFFKRNLLKSLKLLYRTGNRTYQITNIKLNYFLAIVVSTICHRNRCGNLFIGFHVGFVQLDVTVCIRGVAEAIPKRVEGFVRYVKIVRAKFFKPCTISQWASGVFRTIIKRNLSNVLWKGSRKFSRRIHIAKE